MEFLTIFFTWSPLVTTRGLTVEVIIVLDESLDKFIFIVVGVLVTMLILGIAFLGAVTCGLGVGAA